MRRIARRATQRPCLDERIEFELLVGRPAIGSHTRIALLRELWFEHRDYLRQKWQTDKMLELGYVRCFSEWLFEIVPQYGERQIINEAIRPFRANWLRQGILHTHLSPPAQESEVDFLARHGLLDNRERQFFEVTI